MIYNPIVIKDVNKPIENTRSIYWEENNLTKKGMIFSSYVTEKQRLDRLEKEKKEEEKKNKEREKLKNEHNLKISDNILMGLIFQPDMRFKARTDLERIFDALNSRNSLNNEDKSILNKHLKTLGIGTVNKITPENINEIRLALNKSHSATQQNTLETLSENKSVKKREKYVPINRNKEAKKIMKHLHLKTHFKASASLIVDNNALKIPDKYLSTVKSSVKQKNQITIDFNKLKNVKYKDIYKSKEKEFSLMPVSQNNFYKNDNNDDPDFKLNYNPLVKFEENTVDYLKLRKLKALINNNHEDLDPKGLKYPSLVKRLIKNKKSKKLVNENDSALLEEKKEDDKIVIDHVTINKNETDKIATKILYKCNYFHKKSKNNDVFHRSRKGKLMCTNGMTVRDFEKEYGFEFVTKK